MLKIQQFDIKSGKALTEYDPETKTEKPRIKAVEHSYLEHWLDKHGLNDTDQLAVANFYEGVTDRDRQRQEEQNRILVFTNGKKGYFTDRDTANLIVNGDPDHGIQPIYAANQDSAHNLVAYGSLVSSDGLTSAVRSAVRILVIDDEARNPGEIWDWEDNPLDPVDVDRILDKMGDGTMLVSFDLMQSLRSDDEINADVNLKNTVTQFRAASPDFPGIAKGTAGVSGWCEYLAVDAIVAKNDIKGDDGRFSTPGIKVISELWVNRKADAEYGEQSVGPQVKGCLPEATIGEFNPEMLSKGETLAAVANDPPALAQKYIEAKEKLHQKENRVDPIAALLKADPNGLLIGFERVNRELERFLRNERLDLATHGIEVPSAMAQHHNALKPWEVANKDLPQGAIVAYYRSPFANVGSAAIAINNHRALRHDDPEAHEKDGVAYMHPWTAKHVAVTDFDRDTNGYFVGFIPTNGDDRGIGSTIAQQLREQLADVGDLPFAQQYEAGRAAIANLIEDYHANSAASLIQPAQYPNAVTEIVALNTPDHKPPDIIKAPKVKHDWNIGQEPHSAATWRAWETTANNPTGRVANAGMTLRSFAMEAQYIPDDQSESLLQQISQHYQEVSHDRQLVIPTDKELALRGYQAYGFADRIKSIGQAGTELKSMTDPADRLAFTREQLSQVTHLLNDFVDGPHAENLQTAVDVAKSKRGIDEDIQKLAKALAYKDDELRIHRKDPNIYKDGNPMPTNTEEPIGWGVQQANELYDGSQLQQNIHASYYGLLPNIATQAQQTAAQEIAEGFNELQKRGAQEKHLDKQARENQQPTFTIATNDGTKFTIQRPIDVTDQDRSPIWNAGDGLKPDWTITIRPNPDKTDRYPESYKADLQIGSDQRQWELGYILELIETRRITSPEFVINAPLTEQPPAEQSFQAAREFLEARVAAIPTPDRPIYAGALWHSAENISAAIAGFQPEIITALEQQQLPQLKLTGLQYNLDPATFDPTQPIQVRFEPRIVEVQQDRPDGKGKITIQQERMDVKLIAEDGSLKPLGTIQDRDIRLPKGTTAIGHLELRDDSKRAFEFAGKRIVVDNVDRYDARHRLFDENPVQLSFEAHPDNGLKDKEPLVIVSFTENTTTQILGTLKQKTAQDAGLSDQVTIEAIVDNQVQPPGKSIVGTLKIDQILSRQAEPIAITEPIQAAGSPGFNPSRTDLRAWYTAIVQTSPTPDTDPRLGEVQSIGRLLNLAYAQEHGLPTPTTQAQVETPMHYWHPNVSLTAEQNQARVAVMTLAKQEPQKVSIER
jgi:hypothetical protein